VEQLGTAIGLAAGLIAGLDAELLGIVGLSLAVSLSASVAAFVIGAPLGALLAMASFPGRGTAVVLANALMGLPPVVVGLVLYLMLSRAGPLGGFGLLFTPGAMVAAQTVLALPIVVALVQRSSDILWRAYGDSLRANGAAPLAAGLELLRMGRASLLTAFLAAFGRAIAEVGAIIVVGGNIRGYTRTMTTTIALETSKGDLPLALALGLILVTLSVAISAGAFSFERWRARR
jgi:tungstate transport system permease protein